MKLKQAVTLPLLLFVGASIVYWVVAEAPTPDTKSPATIPDGQTGPAAGSAAPVEVRPGESTAAAAPGSRSARKTIAFYFHGMQRCPTCLAIERLAHETLNEQFAAELSRGELEWRVLNTEEPANTHYVKSYNLVTSSLVLVKMRDGAEESWTNLDRVWTLVHDEPDYKRYIVEQVRGCLEQ